MKPIFNGLSRFKLITFDITGTLIKLKIHPGQHYYEVGAAVGLKSNSKDWKDHFNYTIDEMWLKYPNFGLEVGMPWQQWWRQLAENLFNDNTTTNNVDALDSTSQILLNFYKSADAWELTEGCMDLLNYLKDIGITVGAISNFDPRLNTILQNMNISKYFTFIMNSYETGAYKPQGRIFERALQKLHTPGVLPSEALHVGDGPISDYLGAREALWHAILIKNTERRYQLQNFPNINEFHVMKSLEEFHTRLKENAIPWK